MYFRKKIWNVSGAGDFESAAATCKLEKQEIKLVVLYRPPNLFINKLEILLNPFNTHVDTILIGGDFT